MATAGIKTQCVTCGKDKVAYKCDGCSQRFCFYHLAEHRQQLEKQLDDIENQRNIFRQTLSEQTTNLQKYSFIQQINQWEQKSIEKIKQAANEARDSILKYTNEYIEPTELNLTKLTEEIKEIREENDFNEMNLNELKEKLKELEEQLNQPSNITIIEGSLSFIKKISVVLPSEQLTVPNISIFGTWKPNGITVAGGDGRGNRLNQLYYPMSVCIDDKQNIYIADQCNHRIVEWKKDARIGQVIAGGNGQGTRNDQLYCPTNVIIDYKNDSLIISDAGNRRVVRWPRNGTIGETIISDVWCLGLALDNDGYLYVADVGKHEVKRWNTGEINGTLVAGGNGKGNRLNQLDGPSHIFLDQNDSVFVSDSENHRVMKWMKDANEGIVVAGGGSRKEDTLARLSNPQGIIVDQLGTVYVSDSGNDRVMRWLKEARGGSVVVGGDGRGEGVNQFNSPKGLSFDQQNNLYIADWNNNRVQKFHFDSYSQC